MACHGVMWRRQHLHLIQSVPFIASASSSLFRRADIIWLLRLGRDTILAKRT